MAESGTNTTVTTNAKTGKSKMTTTETENLWCYSAEPPEELKLTIMPITSGDQASELGKAEKAANAWMQNLTTTAGGCEAKLVITKELIGDTANYHRSLGEYTTFPRAQFHWAVRVTKREQLRRQRRRDRRHPPVPVRLHRRSRRNPHALETGHPRSRAKERAAISLHTSATSPPTLSPSWPQTAPSSAPERHPPTQPATSRSRGPKTPPEETSNTVHVEVVLHSKFVKPPKRQHLFAPRPAGPAHRHPRP